MLLLGQMRIDHTTQTYLEESKDGMINLLTVYEY